MSQYYGVKPVTSRSDFCYVWRAIRSCDTIRDRSYAACDTRYAVKLSLRHHTQHAIGDEVIGIGGENYRHVITRGMRYAYAIAIRDETVITSSYAACDTR